MPFDVPNNMMTGSVMKVENAEFEKLFKINKLALEKGVGMYSNNKTGIYTSEMKNVETI